jgi:methyl-accepting chemotaxis protein
MEGVSLLIWWRNLGLQTRFMLIIGSGLLVVVSCVIALIAWFEVSNVEAKLRDASQSEISTLSALVVSVMEQRVDDDKDVAITVFNQWFEHRNVDYSGKLWSVWSPQVSKFMADTGQTVPATRGAPPKRADKPAQDAIDEEALRTGRPIGRFVDGAYRYSLPIVLGSTPATDQKTCHDCHGGGMNLADGQVIAVFSSSLSTTAEFAALRRLLAEIAGAAVVGTLILMLMIRAIFARVISRRLIGMTVAMRRLAGGDLAIEIPATYRADEVGQMAEAMLVFRGNAEAARAGDAGKGFAVVAGEVKALASQTEKATKEIDTQIGAIRTATGEAAAAVRQVSASIGEVEQVAAAIAAAVEEQAAVTRDIAASVQTVTAATQDATKAMREVSAVSESTEVASRSVLEGADEVGRNADTLHADMDHFLAAMAQTEDDEHRLYERIPGGGAVAVLRSWGGKDMRAVVQDVSRGGISLRCDWQAAAGTEVQIVLPGTDRAVTARMVRVADGLVGLTFRHDPATLALVGAALKHISTEHLATAA